MTAYARIVEALGDRVEREGKNSCAARCPSHEDDTASLTVTAVTGKALVHCHAGCDTEAILRALHLTPADLFDEKPQAASRVAKVYDYLDASGVLVCQKVRFEPKDFRLRKPDGAGGWLYKKVLEGVTPPLYRLPGVLAVKEEGEPLCIVEGEKDVDTLVRHGFNATCNIHGAAKPGQTSKWKPSDTAQLDGIQEIVLLPDNDDAGHAHVTNIVKGLAKAAWRPMVRVVELPELPAKGDVSDWFANGGTAEALRSIIAAAQLATPADALRALKARTHATNSDSDATPNDEQERLQRADLSEDHLAQRFTEQHGTLYRYCAQTARWLRYVGTHYEEDSTLAVYDEARRFLRHVVFDSGLTTAKKDWKKVRSAATVASIEKLCRSDRVHAVTVDALDRDPWLLNTPAGVIDLRTGERSPNDPAHLCTKVTAVAPDDSMDASLWRRVLLQWADGRQEIVDYLQRLAGYALTGLTQEHALVFLFGTGGNGKSAFLRALTGAMGPYAVSAPISTFTESKYESHPTELARLRGARLVVTTETERGSRWAESRIKALTGGDRIAARFMRQDFFEFDPHFTLIVAGNHRPQFGGIDESIRRRLHLVPFDRIIPTDERDTELDEKLRALWPAVLAWSIRGAAIWHREGLNPPDAVRAATADFLESEDAIGAWMSECLDREGTAWTPGSELFRSWHDWATKRGEVVGSSKQLYEELRKRGVRDHRMTAARGFLGIRVASNDGNDGPPIIDVYARTHAHTRTRTHAGGTPIKDASSFASLSRVHDHHEDPAA